MTPSSLPPLGVDLPLLVQIAQDAMRAHLARHPAEAPHTTLHYQPDLPVPLDVLLGTQQHADGVSWDIQVVTHAAGQIQEVCALWGQGLNAPQLRYDAALLVACYPAVLAGLRAVAQSGWRQ